MWTAAVLFVLIGGVHSADTPPAIPHCIKMNGPECVQCMGGFVIYSRTECRPCPQGCLTCDAEQATCSECQGAYFKDGLTCKACMPSCETCSTAKVCDVCTSGFKMMDSLCVRDSSRAYYLSALFAAVIAVAGLYSWYYINWIHARKEKVLKPVIGKDALHCGEADSHQALMEAEAFARLNPFGPDEATSVNAHLAYNIRRVTQMSETAPAPPTQSESKDATTHKQQNKQEQSGPAGPEYQKMSSPEEEQEKDN